jgi:hypothetical protein
MSSFEEKRRLEGKKGYLSEYEAVETVAKNPIKKGRGCW